MVWLHLRNNVPLPDRNRVRSRIGDCHGCGATGQDVTSSSVLVMPVDGIYVGIFRPQKMSTTVARQRDMPQTRRTRVDNRFPRKTVIHSQVSQASRSPIGKRALLVRQSVGQIATEFAPP